MESPLILLALLCSALGCAAVRDKQFGCMYDQVAWNNSAMPAKIVESGRGLGKVKGATMSAGATEWEAIRFKFFTEDLKIESRYCTEIGQSRPTFIAPSHTAVCKQVDVLSDDKKKTLLDHMIPAALKLHSDRLLVQPVSGNIIVPVFSEGFCASLTIPASHANEGVSNVDMIMYVAAGPTGTPKAWAGTCSIDPDSKRPVIGVMNVGPAIIGTDDNGVRVAAHEIAHALGFGIDNMRLLNMVSSVQNIRGWDRLVVSSAPTLREAKAHYKCENILGMELENEGGDGTVDSHWERRNARDELMAGLSEIGYYTALTMSAFHSMGYYRANWGMEETMEWGRNKGCRFLEEKCVTNGNSNFPDMFCTDPPSSRVCTFGRRGLGMCRIGNAGSNLPAAFQYFNVPNKGGASPLLDFCPMVVQYSNSGCKDGDVQDMPGSRVGPSSQCLKGEGLRVQNRASNAVQDICAEISCENNIVRVRYAGNDEWHKCPEGSTIVPKGSFTAGKIVCPSYAEVCGGREDTTVTSMGGTIDTRVATVTARTTTVKNEDITSVRTDTEQNVKDGTSPSTTLAVLENPLGESNPDPSATGNNGVIDGNSKSTTRPAAVAPIKKSTHKGTDVKKPGERVSASPVLSGSKMVNMTKTKVDSSCFLSCWCGRFIPPCAGLIYIFALCWAF